MGLLDRLVTGSLMASTPGPLDDFWYSSAGSVSQAGVRVDEHGARKLSAWYRGRDLLATTLAMLPWNVYERLPNDAGSEVARQNPLYDVLHTKPNSWQNSYDYRRQKMFHLIDFGNGYDFIVPGARGFVHELWPIHPSLVTPEQLPSRRVVFHVRDPKGGTSKTYTQDEIFHLRGASDDGVVGKGVLQYARDSIGLGLAVDSYSGKIFGQGTVNGGYIKTPGVLNDEAARRMAQSFLTRPGEWGMPKVLEQGAEFTESKMSPEDFQMILSRQYSVTEIARWLGLPPHMVGDLERATFSNIEHQGQEFVTYSLGPWLSLFEFSANDQLVLNTSRFYTEFVREALVRGDVTARSAADVAYVNAGIETVDEVRARNNKNKMGGKAAELRDPQNITGKGTEGGPSDNQRPGKQGEPDAPAKAEAVAPVTSQARAIVRESASRVLRKEIAAARKAAPVYAKDQIGWEAWCEHFYEGHAALVMSTMLVSDETARGYCALQCADLVDGIAAVESWTPDYLAGLALDVPPVDPLQLAHAALNRPVPDVHVYPDAVVDQSAHTHEQHNHAHTHVQALPPEPPKVTGVTKRVERDTTGRIARVIETHARDQQAPPVTVTKRVNRDASGQIIDITETREGD